MTNPLKELCSNRESKKTNPLEEFCSNQELKKQRLQDEDKKTCLDLDQVLNFIESKTKKNQSQAMKTAFSMAKDNGMRPIWITQEQALKLNKEIKYNVFIIESFKTEIFDILLKNKNCSIYGPSTIFYCTSQFNLPRRQFPIFNLCMRNLEICFDKHFERDELVKFFGLISLMCGKFSVKFKPTTTHLISDCHTSEKAILARTYGVPIMQSQWVRECWETTLSKETNADDKAIISKFRLPVFQGFYVTTTQVDSKTKEKIKNLILQNGGEFNGAFHPKKVTHLVIGEPIGEKYETAKKRKINIMNTEWITESVKHGYPLIEYDFLVEKPSSPPKKFDFSPYVHLLTQKSTYHSFKPSSQIISQANSEIQTRTQFNSQIQTQIRTQINSEINTQYKTQPETQLTQQSNLVTSNKQTSQILTPIQTQEHNTTQQTTLQQTQPDSNRPQPPNPAKTYCVKSKAELEKAKNAFSVLTSSQNRQPKTSTNLEDELDKLVTRLDNCRSSIFDGCEFFIYDDLQQNVKLLLKKCITSQNGTISTALRKSVSHVIVKEDRSDVERKQLSQELDKKFDHNVHQVNLKWIIQCSKSNKLLPLLHFNTLNVSASQPVYQQEKSYPQQPSTMRRTRPNRRCSSQPVNQSIRIAEETADDFLDDYCITGLSQQENQEEPIALKPQQNQSQSNSYFNSQSTVTAPSETSSFDFDNIPGSQCTNNIQENLALAMQNKLDNLMTVLNTEEPATKSKATITTSSASITTRSIAKSLPSRSTSTETITEAKKGKSHSQTVTSTTTATSSKEVLDTSANTSVNTTITNLDQLQIDILNENQQYAKKDELTSPSIPIAWNDQRQKQGANDRSFSLPSNLGTFNQTPEESVYDKSRPRSENTYVRSKLIEKPQAESFQVFQDESIEQSRPQKKNRACKFNFIGYTPQEKAQFASELAKLKIILNENNDLDYDYLVTHEAKLLKNECFFVSMAMGKWICHPDFYKRTLELGSAPDPLEYEWGSNEMYLNRLDNKYVQLAKACRYWRLKVSRTGKYAFNDQYLAIVSTKAYNFASIITNGGGQVFPINLKDDTKESYQNALTDLYEKLKKGSCGKLKYILINYRKKDQDKLDLVNLIKPIEELNYPCLSIDYLSLFLVWDTGVKLANCRIGKQQSPNLKRSLNNSDDTKQSKLVKR